MCPTNKLYEHEISKILKQEEDTNDSDMQVFKTGNNSPNLSFE